MSLEDKIGRLEDAILQLTVQVRELTDIYIGAIEAGDLSALIPAAVELRNKRADRKGTVREYSLADARMAYSDYHRTFGEKKAEELMKSFGVQTVSHIEFEDLNRFVLTIREQMEF